jgi:hypothetical protein
MSGGIDLGALADAFHRAFPVLPGTRPGEEVEAIEQFSSLYRGNLQVLRDPILEWSQGDILSQVLFIDFDNDGNVRSGKAPGMIATSTCDLDRKENVLFMRCLPLQSLERLSSYKEIPKNKIYQFLYIGQAIDEKEWVVDLSAITALPRQRVLKNIEEGKIHRLHSLTREGWYLFITKFAMNYLRTEDGDNMATRGI